MPTGALPTTCPSGRSISSTTRSCDRHANAQGLDRAEGRRWAANECRRPRPGPYQRTREPDRSLGRSHRRGDSAGSADGYRGRPCGGSTSTLGRASTAGRRASRRCLASSTPKRSSFDSAFDSRSLARIAATRSGALSGIRIRCSEAQVTVATSSVSNASFPSSECSICQSQLQGPYQPGAAGQTRNVCALPSPSAHALREIDPLNRLFVARDLHRFGHMNSHAFVPPANDAAAVRQEILSQHMELRRLLDCTNRLVQAVAPEAEYVKRLRSGAAVLLRSLERHMVYEEAVLVPILRETDTWGGLRADRLIVEHARQREELQTMADLSTQEQDGRGIGLALQALIADVLADMKHEEASHLTIEVLYDAPLSTARG